MFVPYHAVCIYRHHTHTLSAPQAQLTSLPCTMRWWVVIRALKTTTQLALPTLSNSVSAIVGTMAVFSWVAWIRPEEEEEEEEDEEEEEKEEGGGKRAQNIVKMYNVGLISVFIGCIRNTFIVISLTCLPLGFKVVTVMFRCCTKLCKIIETKLQIHKKKRCWFERVNEPMHGSSIHA